MDAALFWCRKLLIVQLYSRSDLFLEMLVVEAIEERDMVKQRVKKVQLYGKKRWKQWWSRVEIGPKRLKERDRAKKVEARVE